MSRTRFVLQIKARASQVHQLCAQQLEDLRDQPHTDRNQQRLHVLDLMIQTSQILDYLAECHLRISTDIPGSD